METTERPSEKAMRLSAKPPLTQKQIRNAWVRVLKAVHLVGNTYESSKKEQPAMIRKLQDIGVFLKIVK